MKKVFAAIVILGLCFSTTFAQDKVRERDLKGEWKMIIDIDLEDVEDELSEASWFGWAIASSVSGFVSDILEEIDIRMKFMDGGRLKITVDAFGDEEVEWAEWYINKEGQLVITDDDDDYEDDDDVWMMEGKKLVSFHKRSSGRLEAQDVYMEKL